MRCFHRSCGVLIILFATFVPLSVVNADVNIVPVDVPFDVCPFYGGGTRECSVTCPNGSVVTCTYPDDGFCTTSPSTYSLTCECGVKSDPNWAIAGYSRPFYTTHTCLDYTPTTTTTVLPTPTTKKIPIPVWLYEFLDNVVEWDPLDPSTW